MWIGLCYDFDGYTADECALAVEQAATQDLPPWETHRLLLTVGGETFCLGELRFDTEQPDARSYFNAPYTWVAMDSDLCDAAPEELLPEAAPDFDPTRLAFVVGFDAEAHTVEVLLARQTPVEDDGYLLDPDSIADAPITLTVPEDAWLTVADEYACMPVTRERFFRLLADGYVGFLPAEDEDYYAGVLLGYSDGSLTYLMEDDPR